VTALATPLWQAFHEACLAVERATAPHFLEAVTDAQEQKLFWMTQNGAWTFTLRPPKDASDSPEAAESFWTLLEDGLKAQQIEGLWNREDDQ